MKLSIIRALYERNEEEKINDKSFTAPFGYFLPMPLAASSPASRPLFFNPIHVSVFLSRDCHSIAVVDVLKG
jgi:hypothetical protein